MEQQPRNGEVAIRDFTAGLVDIIDDNLIPDGAALKADNCISRTIGKLSKRRGYKADHPTPLSEKDSGDVCYYNNAGTRRVIVANNGKYTAITEKNLNLPSYYRAGLTRRRSL